MSLSIFIQVADDVISPFPFLQLKKFIQAAWLSPKAKSKVTLRIVDESESRQLNTLYRGKAKPTNILSFSYNTPEYLGDLVVCAPWVALEAVQQEKSLLAHWAHLLIHGMLHLQGYDHQQIAEQKIMENLEIDILNQLNFPNPYSNEGNND